MNRTAITQIIKNTLRSFVTVFFLFGMASLASAQTTEVLTTASGSTWTAPAGVTSVLVECWGAGGGGAGDGSNDNSGVAGGGGGAYAKSEITVVPGNNYSFIVGTGGTGGSGANGSSGGTTSFNTISCIAPGGSGGTDSTGTGGTGATGNIATENGGNASPGSGVDGGSGGLGASSSDPLVGVVGTGGTDGNNGGSASPYASGGGGSGDRSGGSEVGGDGSDGVIRLTYSLSGVSIGGTLYEADGTTPITTGKTIAAAVGVSTPALYSATSDGSGNFSIEGIATSTGGETWTARSAAGDNDSWMDVTYGNGRFVAVANGGNGTTDRVMYSDDGYTWTVASAAGNDDPWEGVTYGDGLFVAVSVGNDRVMTSPDGINWTARSAAGNDDGWREVAYGNGLFVAVGTGGDRVMTSPDGITWTARSAAGDNDDWYGITYGNGLFVAVGTNGDRVMTSPDGINWTVRSAAGNDDNWVDITYGDGLFVAVSPDGGLDKVMTSPDGITWTARSAAGDNDAWRAVTYANGTFVAAAGCSIPGGDCVMNSPDGINWTVQSHPSANDFWMGIAYGEGKFVAVGDECAYGAHDCVMTADAGFGEDTSIVLFVDNEGEDATTITYGLNDGQDINGIKLLQNTVNLQPATTTKTIDFFHAQFYDVDQDIDVLFDVESSTTTVAGNLLISSGVTAFVNEKLIIGGDFKNNGVFTSGDGIVRLEGPSILADVSYVDSLDYSVQDGSPRGLEFHPDGTKLYLVGSVNDAILEWSLSTPFDISTAVYTDMSVVSSQDTSPQGVAFNGDGTNMYIAGFTDAMIDEWALSVPYDVSTGVYTDSLSISAYDNSPGDVDFNADGTKMYLTGWATNSIYEFSLPVPYDVSTAVYTDSLDISATTLSVREITFNANGTRVYANDITSTTIDEYSLSVPYDISTGEYVGSLDVSAEAGSTIQGVALNASGTKLYVASSDPDVLLEYDIVKTSVEMSGNLSATSALSNLEISGNMPVTLWDDAAVANLTIDSRSELHASSTILTVAEDFTNNGAFDSGSGTVQFVGSSAQTATGTLSGASAFHNMTITNSSTDGATAQAVTFGSPLTVGSTFSMEPSSSAAFLAGATSTLQNIDLEGEFGSPVWLRSTIPGTDWLLDVPGAQTNVSYVNVADSDATPTSGGIAATESQDSGNNTNWSFAFSPLTITGTLYEADGTTPITTSKTITAAVGTSTPSLYSTSTDASGNFTVDVDAPSGGGVTWSTTTPASAFDELSAVTYGNGQFVAVSTCYYNGSNCVVTSPDGETWTARSVGTANGEWLDIAYGNGLFVAVSLLDDRLMTSPDGITWTERSVAGDNDQWSSVTYGNGRFVAVANTGDWAMYSDDGITWSVSSTTISGGWEDVTYGNGQFVAVATFGFGENHHVMTSSDGDTWTAYHAAEDNDWRDIEYGNGVYVAVANQGTNRVMTSPDGQTWTARSIAGNDDDWRGLSYANGVFVAVADCDAGGDCVATSPDGITWTVQTMPSTGDSWRGITYGAGKFVAVSSWDGPNRVMLSDAGFGENTPITLFVDGETEDATTLTYGLNQSGTISGVDLTQDTVQLKHSSTSGAIDFANVEFYDADDDADILIDSDMSTTTINGSLAVSANTQLLASPYLDIQSNLTIDGTFAHQNGEVILSGTNQILTTLATTTFNDFTAESVSARTLSFTSGQEYVFDGALTLTGADGQLMSLAATTPGTEYFFRPNGATTTEYLSVQDSHNISTVNTSLDCSTGCVDGGNNSGWNFPLAPLTLSGTLYQNDGVTPITTGKTIVAAIGTSTPSLYSTTTDASGNFNITEIATSTIGSWATTSVMGDNDHWEGYAYGNGVHIMVANFDGQDGQVGYSVDGLNWVQVDAMGNDSDWEAVTYGNGQFVAVGDGGADRVMTSPDGLTWTPRSAAGDNDTWIAVTYGSGRYVAVGTCTTVQDCAMYSDDGINWTVVTMPNGNNDEWKSISYGDGRFVAMGKDMPVAVSTDGGETWTPYTILGDDDSWEAVVYGDGKFVAVSDDSGDKLAYSTDGTSWTSADATSGDNWKSVAYGNGLFVAVASNNSNTIAYSRDGINWTKSQEAGGNDGWRIIGFGGGRFMAASDANGTDDGFMYADAGFGADTPITIFVDNETENASALTYGRNIQDGGGNLGVDLYQDTVRIQAPNASGALDMSDLDFYDATDDADVLFTATTTLATINGDFEVTNGTSLGAPPGLAITGDVLVGGTFEHQNGEVLLTGGNQTITTSATTTFNDFTAATTSARTLTFTSGEEYVFTGELTLSGADGQLTSLDASTPGTEYYFRPDSTVSASYLDVQDSHNISATTTDIECLVGCVDSGNNMNWTIENQSQTTVSFQEGVDGYYGTIDTEINAVSPDSSYGAASSFGADGNTDLGGLVRWDLSNIPTNATINAVELVFNVSNESGNAYPVYESLVPWTEDATWNAYDGLAPWGTAGSQAAGTDYVDDSLGLINLGSGVTGVATVTLATNGVNVVQDWITTPSTNNGFILFNYDDASSNGVDISSSENSTVANRPKIIVTYSAPAQQPESHQLSGTLYENDGVTPITTGKTVVAAVGTSTPSLHSTTTDGSGNFSITNIVDSAIGETWTARTAAGDNDRWRDVTYGNGRFVAVGDGDNVADKIMYSDDGYSWTVASSPNDWDDFKSVTYGNGLFVAVGSYYSLVVTSPDGINWTERSVPGRGYWKAVTYGNGLFVAVANSGDRVMTSPDGINWTPRVSADDTADWYSVTYGDGLFVAVAAYDGVNRVMTSPDGINWTARSAAGDDSNWMSVTYGNGLFVAVAQNGNNLMTSPDGINWTDRSLVGNNEDWRGVEYINGSFVAVSRCAVAGEDCVAISPDGINWTAYSATGEGRWEGVAYGNGTIVAVGDGCNFTATSTSDCVMTADAGFGENTPITLYVDGETEDATTLTYGLNEPGTIAGLDLVRDTVQLKHSSTSGAIDLSDADFYDAGDDADILVDITTATTTISGTLAVNANTTVLAPQHLDILSDLTIIGTFAAERGEVLLSGANPTLTTVATTTFHDFTAATTSARTLTFTSGQEYVFTGDLTLSGADGQLTSLDASTPGTEYYFRPNGASSTIMSTEYLDVQDSHNISTTYTDIKCVAGCVDGGNNVNWTIDNQTQTTVSFQDGADGYYGTIDTYISVQSSSTSHGNYPEFEIEGNNDDAGLVRWNLSSIPTNATIEAVELVFYVGNSSWSPYPIHESLQPWTEDATYNAYDGSTSWGTAGGQSAGVDYVNDSLGEVALGGGVTGFASIPLTNNGINVVQDWVTNPSSNNGFMIFDYDDDKWDDIEIHSSENSTIANRPKIIVTYSAPAQQPETHQLSGTLYENDGVTPITTGKTVVAAVGTSTPSLHSTTTDGSGNFTITDIVDSEIGETWTARTAAGDNDRWRDVTYGNGRFVAVGDGDNVADKIMYSDDGYSWTVASSPNGWDDLYAVTYGQGLFVAVGWDPNRVVTSHDGINWTPRSVAGNNDSWKSITYVNGLFVAVSSVDDRVMTSPDGINWTVRSAAGDNDSWSAVTYGNGLFVAVADSGDDRVITSPDGITWTARTAAENNNWAGLAYGNGVYVAVSSDGVNRAMTSPDGITWTARPLVGNNEDWRSVEYINGSFVAVSRCAVAGEDCVAISPDGINWTAYSATGEGRWEGVAYGNGTIVAVGDGCNFTATSTSDCVMTADAGFGENTPITLYVDGETEDATTLTYGLNEPGTIAGLDLVRDTVQLKHSSTSGSINLADADFYDADDDADILFDADTSTTTISGSLAVAANTTVLAPQHLDISSNITINGTFADEDGEVLLTGGNQTLTTSATTTFHDFTAESASARTLTFTSGEEYVFDGALTLTGADGQLTSLAATTPGTEYYFRPNAASSTIMSTQYLDVQDSHNISTTNTNINCYINCVDSGNNVNWTIGSLTQTTVSFQEGVNGYAGTIDTEINAVSPDTSYGSSAIFGADGNTDKGGLVKWDLSSIPTNATINAVELVFNVSNESGNAYPIYESLIPWTEDATWNAYDGFAPWGTAGGQSVGTDYVNDSLGLINLGSGVTGVATVTLATNGINVVQDWVTSPSTNNGFIIFDYNDGTSNGVQMSSSEHTTVNNRPQIIVTYSTPPPPTTISLSGTLYENDGITPITTGKSIVAAVGTSTPSLHSATSDGSGNFTVDLGVPALGGVTWSTTTAAGDDDELKALTYGNSQYVAVSTCYYNSSDCVLTSPDGETWTARSTGVADGEWQDIAYGEGVYVAVALIGDRVMTSPDGITWTARSAAGNDDQWSAVTYGNGRFVAVANTGDWAMYSDDGLTWSTSTSVISGGWSDVTYANGQFVAVATFGFGDNHHVMTSLDGDTWTAYHASEDNDWRGLAYGNGVYVAVSSDGVNRAMTSPDGQTWTARSIAGNNDDWRDLTFSNGVFVAVADCDAGGDCVATSPDGIAWTVQSAPANSWRGVAAGSGKIVAVGAWDGPDRVMYSESGLNASTPVTLYVDNETENAVTLTYGLDSVLQITGMDLIRDTVRLQHASTSDSVDLSDTAFYDSSDDADILIDITTSTTTITGDLLVHTNSTALAPENLLLTGDLTINGAFDAQTGEVHLTGGDQTLTTSATTTFHDFTAATTSARTITFTSGEEYVFEGVLTLTGADSNLTSLAASTPATEYYFRPHATATTQYLNVTDSHNISATTTSIDCSTGCVDGGNNVGWQLVVLFLSLLENSGGQVSNTFSFQNKTDTELFAFRLSTSTVGLTVTDLDIALTGIKDVSDSNLANVELYVDVDNDGAYDNGLDTLVGAGAVSINGDTGTITFTSDFAVTAGVDYLVIGDTNAIDNGSFITFNLYPADIQLNQGIASGTISHVQHIRNNRGGGGGSAAAIVDTIVPGDGDVGGGGAGGGGEIDTNTGGALIGNAPGFRRPSANSGGWTTPANAYDNTDGTYATDSEYASSNFTDHGFAIAGSDTIEGIVVKLEVSGTTAAGTIDVQLSWDGGTTWTTAKTTPTLTTTDAVVSLGGVADKWGRTWTPAEFANANFAIRLTGSPSANTVRLDEIQVRVYHQATGGGGGGGGAI